MKRVTLFAGCVCVFLCGVSAGLIVANHVRKRDDNTDDLDLLEYENDIDNLVRHLHFFMVEEYSKDIPRNKIRQVVVECYKAYLYNDDPDIGNNSVFSDAVDRLNDMY